EIEAPHGATLASQAAALRGSETCAWSGFSRGGRAVTMRTTAATIEAPATTVVHWMCSPRKSVPSATATTGFTNAYVETMEIRTFLSSHGSAENAMSEPTTTR